MSEDLREIKDYWANDGYGDSRKTKGLVAMQDVPILMATFDARQEELKQAYVRIESLLQTEKRLRQTISNLEYLYDKERGALHEKN